MWEPLLRPYTAAVPHRGYKAKRAVNPKEKLVFYL